jgi:hypothetical protein
MPFADAVTPDAQRLPATRAMTLAPLLPFAAMPPRDAAGFCPLPPLDFITLFHY